MTSAESRSKNSQARIWIDVQRSQAANRCKCDLREGMAWEDLRPLGAGCTDPWYCCDALALYRRLVPMPPMEEV